MSKRILIGVLAGCALLLCVSIVQLIPCTVQISCADGYTAWCSATGAGAHCNANEGAGWVTCGNDYFGHRTWRCPQAI